MAFQLVSLANGLNQYVNVAGGLVPRGAYDPLVSYVIGDMVDFNGSSYVMYNLAPAGNEPTDATFWGMVAEKGTPGGIADFQGDWATGVAYGPDVCVTNLGSSYYSTVAHTSDPSTEPGVGVDWATVWQLSAAKGANGPGVQAGGTAGQILAKIDGVDFNTEWIDNYSTEVAQSVKLGEDINKGQAVYVSSAVGSNIIVSKADNSSESTSATTIGILKTSGVLNDIRDVVTEGVVRKLDTSTATEGDPVWLGTAGNLLYGLGAKPVAPAHLVFIGIVTRVSTTVGEIYVRPQNGYELSELHDVSIPTAPSDGQALAYETSSGLWKAKTIGGAPEFRYINGANSILAQINANTYSRPLSLGVGIGDYALSNVTAYAYTPVAVGYNALGGLSNGDGNVAVGSFAGQNLNNGVGNVYLGYFAGGWFGYYHQSGSQNVFIGKESGPYNTYSVNSATVVGWSAKGAENATVMGQSAYATVNSVNIGVVGYALGSESVAMGYNSTIQAGANGATAVGRSASASSGAVSSITLGYAVTSNGANSITIGQYQSNNGYNAIGIGYGATSNATAAVAIGSSSNASADNSVAVGGSAMAYLGVYSTAIGGAAMAYGTGTTSLGFNASTYTVGGGKNYATSLGANSQSSENAVATGAYANATYIGGVALGYNARAGSYYYSGHYSMALGYQAETQGPYNIALGAGTIASGTGSVAIGTDSSGTGATTSTTNEIVLGTANHTTHIKGKLLVDGPVYGSIPATGTGNASQDVSTNSAGFIVEALNTNINFNNPTGSAHDMQRFTIRVKADGSGPYTITWSSSWRGGTLALPSTIAASTTTYCEFLYNGLDAKWDLITAVSGI